MKDNTRTLFVAVVLVLSVFVVSACSSMAGVAQLVQLPVPLQAALQFAIEIAVIFLLTQLAKWGFDFSGYKAQIVAAVFGAVLVFINALLAKIPANAEGLAVALLNLVVIILGSYGLHQVYKAVQIRWMERKLLR